MLLGMQSGVLTTLWLPEEQKAQVREQARLEGTTMSKVIRDAIARYLGPVPSSDASTTNYMRG